MKDHETQENAAPGGTCAADGSARPWMCPECGHRMTDEESQGYAGCPTGLHPVQHVRATQVVCRWAGECVRATQCAHGVPHDMDSHCEDPCVCYDIQPSRRAWCVLHEKKRVLDTYPMQSKWYRDHISEDEHNATHDGRRPPLVPTKEVGKGEYFYDKVNGWRHTKWFMSDTSAKRRSITFAGIAEAMAAQWGSLPNAQAVGLRPDERLVGQDGRTKCH